MTKGRLHNQRRGCVTSDDVVWLEYGLFNVRGGCELLGVVSVAKDTLYKWHIEEIFSFLQTWKQPQVEGINDLMWWPCSTWLPWTPLPLPCLMDCFPKVWRQVGRRVTVLQPVALSSSGARTERRGPTPGLTSTNLTHKDIHGDTGAPNHPWSSLLPFY